MNRPLAVDRIEHIAQTLDATGSVSVGGLAETLQVSKETIRRDLKLLADQGRANLVHGGAARPANRTTTEPALAERIEDNAAGKAAICHRAATMVEDGMVVIIDCGSTTLALGTALARHRSLTVITNSLPISMQLCHAPGVNVVMLGGAIEPNDEATFGVETIAALSHYRADVAFISVGGLGANGEMTDFTRLGAQQRYEMMRAARKAYVLVDHTKFERSTPVLVQPVPHIAGLVIDRPLPADISDAVANLGWEVLEAFSSR